MERAAFGAGDLKTFSAYGMAIQHCLIWLGVDTGTCPAMTVTGDEPQTTAAGAPSSPSIEIRYG